MSQPPDEPDPTFGSFTGGSGFEWTAFQPEGVEDETPPPQAIEGKQLRMMPEYGIEIPLWDAGGPVEDRALLERELGLSPALIADLAEWQAEWDDVCSAAVSDDTVPVKPLPKGWGRDHAARGRELFARLKDEIDPRFDVSLHR